MRFICGLLVLSLLSPSALLAGGFEPGFDGIEYGHQPEVIIIDPGQHGQHGQWQGQHGQWTGQHGQHGQWQDYGQVWDHPTQDVYAWPESQCWQKVDFSPSCMTNCHTQWALNGYQEYDQWNQQSSLCGNQDGYWGYWQDQARYDHEMKMTKMQLRYRDREMNRIRKERERQRKHQNRVAGFTMLGASIPFLIGAFQ